MDAAPAGEQRYGHVLEFFKTMGSSSKGALLWWAATDRRAFRNNGQNGSHQGPARINRELAKLYWHVIQNSMDSQKDKGPGPLRIKVHE